MVLFSIIKERGNLKTGKWAKRNWNFFLTETVRSNSFIGKGKTEVRKIKNVLYQKTVKADKKEGDSFFGLKYKKG